MRHVLIRLDLELPRPYLNQYQRELRDREAELVELTAQWDAERSMREEKAYIPSRPYVPMPPDPHVRFLAYGTELEILWDVVDDLLSVLCSEPLPPETLPFVARWNSGARRTKRITEPLNRLLIESRSVYEVASDQRGLQRRMEEGLSEALAMASDAAESSGYPAARRYLGRARDKLFAVHADASGAYVDLIRAVEAVACPMFLPRNPLPTLGKVRDHLRDADAKYEYVLTDKSGTQGTTTGVVAMLTDLWEGHGDRHAGGPREVPVSQEAAEAALSVATALVTLFSRSAVRLRPAGQRRA
ncbi:hypothetical protein CW362_42150 [Streptomyces populi]|uniref:Uncharacterized protein n=2 Tax=Streptomyces populi TaxID=2058924 RepID=A0A2I0SB24_9ACTN|nr:hypothetical protein CW362_42150 [Streptomyces populi]